MTVDIGLLKNGTGVEQQLSRGRSAPTAPNKTITWDGCIEERDTVRTTDYDPIPSGANDLDIDLVPTQGDANTLWGPALPDLIYTRDVTDRLDWARHRLERMRRDQTRPTILLSNGVGYYVPDRGARSCRSGPTRARSTPMSTA